MTNSEQTIPPKPSSYRLYADIEETFQLKRPSTSDFERVRRIALRSTDIPLARKFEICTELLVGWAEVLTIANGDALEKLLANMATPDPAALGEKILAAKDIHEIPGEDALSATQAQAEMARIIFTGAKKHGKPGKLLIGNVRKAAAEYFSMIGVSEDEDYASRTTFKAFTGSDEHYPLADPTVSSILAITELQMACPSIPRADRKQLAAEMNQEFSEPRADQAISKPGYWGKAAPIVLNGLKITDENRGRLDAGEVNRALAVFFLRSEGAL